MLSRRVKEFYIASGNIFCLKSLTLSLETEIRFMQMLSDRQRKSENFPYCSTAWYRNQKFMNDVTRILVYASISKSYRTLQIDYQTPFENKC
jgi:hypothetical protein